MGQTRIEADLRPNADDYEALLFQMVTIDGWGLDVALDALDVQLRRQMHEWVDRRIDEALERWWSHCQDCA